MFLKPFSNALYQLLTHQACSLSSQNYYLSLLLWVKLIDWIEYFSHFSNIPPYCHKLQNLQVLLSRAILNNMDSLIWKCFFCVCFKKFREKIQSFRIRGAFLLLNLSVSCMRENNIQNVPSAYCRRRGWVFW